MHILNFLFFFFLTSTIEDIQSIIFTSEIQSACGKKIKLNFDN